jgi:hypothetical protein
MPEQIAFMDEVWTALETGKWMARPRYTEEQVRKMLERQCHDAGGQKAWADLHNITQQYVCDVLQERRMAGRTIASALGLRRIILYESIK